jgi:CRISPR system Cascade subunit CasA
LLLASRGDFTRPKVFDSLGDLPKEIAATLRVRAFGCDQEGQSRNRQWHTATTPAVLGLIEEHDRLGAAIVATAHDSAEAAYKALTTALRTAWKGITGVAGGDKPPPCPWLSSSGSRYWPLAEFEFWRILDADDRDTTEHRFARIALRVYGDITRAVTFDPKGMKHVEAAKKSLLRLFPKQQKVSTRT